MKENKSNRNLNHIKCDRGCDREPSPVTSPVTFIYSAFGMKIASEIPLPELQPCTGIADVTVNFGKVPEFIDGANDRVGNYQACKNQLLLQVKDVGCYYISNGNQIIIEPALNTEADRIRLYLLGSAMGAILMQRGFLPIHGSAVVVGEYCFIITGVQGVGKSTLTAAFRNKGYSVLTDDVAAIDLDERGIPWVYPSYPQQKLWRDSLESMGNDPDKLNHIFGRIDKYALSIQENFCEKPKMLRAIYELRKENCREVYLKKFTGIEKFPLIMNNIYRLGFAGALDLKEEFFRYSTALAKKIHVSGITRPDGVFTTEDQAALVEMDLKEICGGRK